MNKRYVHADELLLDSFRLAAKIHASGFRPDFLVGLWRGGSAVGIAVQEGLEHFGIRTDHIAIRTSYAGAAHYAEHLGKHNAIRVHGMQYLLENLNRDHSMLIVDDVYSTGASAKAVVDQLTAKARRNVPHDIRVATVWYRPSERTLQPPDFRIHETSNWLVLPYELNGLSLEEIKEHKPELVDVVERLRALNQDLTHDTP